MLLVTTCQKGKWTRGQNCANLFLELCATFGGDLSFFCGISYFFWEIFKTIFDEKFLWKDGFCTKLNIFQGLQVTSIHIYYVLYFAFRDIVFSNVVSMGIENLTLTHASQSCLIQHCKHSHWKYKKDYHYRILPKTWIMCKHGPLSLFLGVVVLLLWQSWWWHGSSCGVVL